MDKILFYKVKEPYGEFSNFSSFGFTDDEGLYWPTSEHYFQAKKFNSPILQEKIRKINSPMVAAIEGRNRENPLREDWEYVKDDIRICKGEQYALKNGSIGYSPIFMQ
ncbi:NADAR family protein [Streptococcus suis]|nr:NADAR family protein [Streptococcus suis]